MDIRQIYTKVILIYIFKHFNTFKQNLNVISHSHNTRSGLNQVFENSKRRTTVGQQHADFIGPRLFNKLPHFIKTETHIKRFKYKIHSWIIEKGRTFFQENITMNNMFVKTFL